MCGQVVCWDCSSQKLVVPGFETKQRVCATCSSSWIQKLVDTRREVQRLKLDLDESEKRISELHFQKSRLQAKNSELQSNMEDMQSKLSKQHSITETLHAQLEEKMLQIMKLKKSVAGGARKEKKKRHSKSNGRATATSDDDLDPNWKPPSALDGNSGADSAAHAYNLSDVADLDDDDGGLPKRGSVDQPCKCTIS